MIFSWDISSEIAFRWMSLHVTDVKASSVQVMAWCHQATSHYLYQCWPRSVVPYGTTRPDELKDVYTENQVRSGPVFCLLLGVSSDYAQPITGQVTEVTCPVIGRAQPELTLSKRQKTGHGLPKYVHTVVCGWDNISFAGLWSSISFDRHNLQWLSYITISSQATALQHRWAVSVML